MKSFQYLCVSLFTTLLLSDRLQESTFHTLIALLPQLWPDKIFLESFLSGCWPTCSRMCGTRPDRRRRWHTSLPHLPLISFGALAWCEPFRPDAWVGCHSLNKSFTQFYILENLLNSSSRRPLKSPASSCSSLAQLFPDKTMERHPRLSKEENQSLHSAAGRKFPFTQNKRLSPQMYSMESKFFWPFLQSELSSSGKFVEAKVFIVFVEKKQVDFPLQRSRTCAYISYSRSNVVKNLYLPGCIVKAVRVDLGRVLLPVAELSA